MQIKGVHLRSEITLVKELGSEAEAIKRTLSSHIPQATGTYFPQETQGTSAKHVPQNDLTQGASQVASH